MPQAIINFCLVALDIDYRRGLVISQMHEPAKRGF